MFARRIDRVLGRCQRVLVAATIAAQLLASVMGFVAPAMALAAGNCAGGPTFTAGWWSTPSLSGHEPEGTKANLTYRTAASCQSVGGGFSAAYGGWVMISGNNQLYKYAQAGFLFDGNPLGCPRHFSEWQNTTSGGGMHRKFGACIASGELHTPQVKYVSGTATELWIDSTKFDTMTICSCSWPRPLEVLWMGETFDVHGDVPGLSGTKADWASGQIQYFSDNSWHGTCGTITLFRHVDNRFDADAPACNHTRSWTAQP